MNSAGVALNWYLIGTLYYLEETELEDWLAGCIIDPSAIKPRVVNNNNMTAARATSALKRKRAAGEAS